MSLYKHKYQTASGPVESQDWYYRFNREGKTYVGSTKTSNKTAAARVEEKKKREVDEAILNGDTQSVTIKQAIGHYLESCEHRSELINIKSRCKKLLGTTIDTRTQTEVEIFGFDGARKFESLTDTDVQQLVLKRRAAGSSNGTILTELTTLSQTVMLVKKLGFRVPDIDFKDIKKVNKVRPSKGRLRYLSAKEEAAFLYQLDPNTQHKREADFTLLMQRQDAYDFAVCLLDLGGRFSEIAGLKWTDLDIKNGTVDLWRNKVQNESRLYATKRVRAILQRRFEAKRDDQVYVFEAKDGTPRKSSASAFDSAFARAHIEGATIHTLRHTFASKLAQNGASLQEIKELMGHASITTTMIYAHLIQSSASKRAVAILDAL